MVKYSVRSYVAYRCFLYAMPFVESVILLFSNWLLKKLLAFSIDIELVIRMGTAIGDVMLGSAALVVLVMGAVTLVRGVWASTKQSFSRRSEL